MQLANMVFREGEILPGGEDRLHHLGIAGDLLFVAGKGTRLEGHDDLGVPIECSTSFEPRQKNQSQGQGN